MSSLAVWSPSKIDCFRRCPLQFHYRYVEQAQEEQRGGALVCGSVAHVAISAAVHDLKAGLRIEELDPGPYFEQAWMAERSATKVPIAWGSGGIEKAEAVTRAGVQKYLEQEDLGERARRIEAIDVPFEVPLIHPDTGLDTGVTLRGFLDFLERTEDGRLRPLELKTAASKTAHSELDIQRATQASAYVYGIRLTHGADASSQIAYTVIVKTKEPTIVDRVVAIGDEEIRRVLLTCLQVQRAAKLEVAFAAVSGWQCTTCPYALRCARSRDLVGTQSPPDAIAGQVLTEASR